MTNAYAHRVPASSGPDRRRGVALLIVLATLLLVTTTLAGLAARAALLQQARRSDSSARTADAMLETAHAAIVRWLESQSGRIVLPPQAPTPRVHVLNDSWRIDADSYQLAITAWDQCGLVPWQAAANRSPLASGLPPRVSTAVRNTPVDPGTHIGLDSFIPAAQRSAVKIFPDHSASPDTAIGSLVATHNPAALSYADSTETTPAVLNVRTAPIPLIDVVLRATSRGGLDQIVEARRQGRPPVVPPVAAPAPPNPPATPQGIPVLTSASSCWSFRIDITVNSVRRSWWEVYSASGPSWECLQRCVIPD